MKPAIASPLIESLRSGAAAVPASTGVIVLGVLFAALVAKTILQGTALLPRREALRLLDVVIAPMLIVFVIVVLERFRDLS